MREEILHLSQNISFSWFCMNRFKLNLTLYRLHCLHLPVKVVCFVKSLRHRGQFRFPPFFMCYTMHYKWNSCLHSSIKSLKFMKHIEHSYCSCFNLFFFSSSSLFFLSAYSASLIFLSSSSLLFLNSSISLLLLSSYYFIFRILSCLILYSSYIFFFSSSCYKVS